MSDELVPTYFCASCVLADPKVRLTVAYTCNLRLQSLLCNVDAATWGFVISHFGKDANATINRYRLAVELLLSNYGTCRLYTCPTLTAPQRTWAHRMRSSASPTWSR